MNKRPTTSFFEQDHSAKSKSNRQKKGPSHRSKQYDNASTKINDFVMPKPASTVTKAQLNAFAFHKSSKQHCSGSIGLREKEKEKENENENEYETEKTLVDVENREEIHPSGANEPCIRPTPPDCPQTPVPRLALTDLMKPADDQILSHPIGYEASPDERILWRVSPRSTPRTLGSQVTPAAKHKKRSKKRAASRSPCTSPKATAAPNKPQMESLLNLGGDLRTPQADPANEIWQRYSTATSSARPANGINPIARLFQNGNLQRVNLSPQGLRRSYSCGPDWPPRFKRRKLESADAGKASPGELEKTQHGKSKLSRVNMLMEKVHKNLSSKVTFPSSCPASSSPLQATEDDYQSSPIPRSKSRSIKPTVAVIEEAPECHSEGEGFGNFDDEDDEEIDFDALDSMVQEAATQINGQVVQPAKGETTPDEGMKQRHSTAQDLAPDEFDDGDEDFYSAEFEDILSKYDTQRSSNAERISTQKGKSITAGSNTFFEEFENIDFDQWDDDLDIDNGITDVNSGSIIRYDVLSVSEGHYEQRNISLSQKELEIRDGRTNKKRTVILREDWYQVEVYKSDVVHVIGKFDKHGVCIVDNARNMLIVHPDFLVSSTTVADSFGCKRRAVLQDRVKASAEIKKALIYGSICHELFQKALSANDFSSAFFQNAIEKVLIQNIEQLYILREEFSAAKEYLSSKVSLLQGWAQIFVSSSPKEGAVATDHRGSVNPRICINKVLDIEERVWSPMYGLKGNIDATVQVVVDDRHSTKILTVPLEMKTGSNSTAVFHRAQTMLYTLLMTDRYDINVLCGILYYMEHSEVIRVTAIKDELRGMIIARNELAQYAKNRDQFPPMLQKRTCKSCFANTTCFIYHKALEDGTTKTSGAEASATFDEITSHIKDCHKAFLKKWDSLISKEERDMARFRKEIWTLTSSEREAKGRAFGNLMIVPSSISVSEEGAKINRFSYTFKKERRSSSFTFTDSQIGVGEPIVISDEKGHFALAMGYVTNVTRSTISVAVDRRLHNARMQEDGFDALNNQSFVGITSLGTNSKKPKKNPLHDTVRYRLDKDEYSNGMALVRNNLIQLLSTKSTERARDLIIDLAEPTFRDASTTHALLDTQLNTDQTRALEKVVSANDYALILGMPGTGKTTTIAHIIRALVSEGKSVLLTSYTHTAVDNILLKIKNDNIKTLRLGNLTKIHPEVKNFALLAEEPRTSFEALNDAFLTPKVVATTCLGVNHTIFSQRMFDYCIVDEASQITLPVCLGPIRMARKFILVGDHYQLPPLVRDQEAKEGGLDISLFKLLSDAHPNAVVNLEHQYRMCEEVMTLSNELIYDGKLKCGNEQVAKRQLDLPNPSGLKSFHIPHMDQCHGGESHCWLTYLLSPSVKACFINTDSLPAPEVKKADRIHNPAEAEITYQLVQALLCTGIPPSSIGIISIYRSQIKYISHMLGKTTAAVEIEMHTADKFQGRDKEIIIISLVRSNSDYNVGDLLKDWRRVNVAFTRAKTKLLLIGSKDTLLGNGNETLGNFVRLMENRKWVYDLSREAIVMHPSIMSTTQARSHPNSPVKRKAPHGSPHGEENTRPKMGVVTKRALLGNRPILRDIANEVGWEGKE